MGKILGVEYSDTQINEYDEKEYYIDDWNDWYTKEEIRETLEEMDYWNDDFASECYEDEDGCDWSDD